MTENTYAALITISLPGKDRSATASVMLHAADVVPVAEQQTRPLRECTLADLQQFAEQWEADVWQIYDEISLLNLIDDEAVAVDISVVDETGETQPISEEMLAQANILIDEVKENEAVAEVPVEEIPVVDTVATAVSPPSSDSQIPDDDSLEPQIAISEPELVYEEREALAADDQSPRIVPSRARVRVAGKRLPLGDPTWTAVDILIEEPAFRAAQAHALSSLSREVAGVLIGPPPEKQPDGRYIVHIFDTIIAKHTVMKGASVTYTPESWRYMNDRLHEKYPDGTAVMVGWYHTHPGFGIFLSGMDQFIHQNFFTQIWHVAQVLDPVGRTSGFFCWNREKNSVNRMDFPWPEWAAGSW